ncbi:GntR family transcriptional regulator [Paenibacillus thermotolerans]|uniref:GntR family transcriptional regulator n=1 Tax=Paenibacillus thermotolerans TaxID=3027807 RepID=UPI0023676EA6|nr:MULTISPECIES: GntR family transcriptional regulator [unclassified Paenibacillus]
MDHFLSPPSSGTPLYKQIRAYILKQIHDNVWKPDQQIPSEHELAEQFQVSRVTVRGALKELAEENIIYRMRGKGSFIHSEAAMATQIKQNSLEGSRFVALLIPRLDNRFTANVVSGIEEVLSAQGYRLLVARTHDSKEIEKKQLHEMVRLGVNGIIVYPVSDETYNEDILKLSLNRFPLVVIDRYLRGIETNCVCSDNIQGAKTATSYLLEHGHSKIAFISSNKITTSIEDRLFGYQQALSEGNIPLNSGYQLYLQANQGKLSSGYLEDLQAFFKDHPEVTACFVTHYSIAFHVIHVLKSMGKAVPRDLSVICFDDYEGSEHAEVPLTCVEQQEYRLGQQSAELLIANIESAGQERGMVKLPTNFIIRSSVSRRSEQGPSSH